MGVLESSDFRAEGGGIREIWGEAERVYVPARGECRDNQLCRTSKRGYIGNKGYDTHGHAGALFAGGEEAARRISG